MRKWQIHKVLIIFLVDNKPGFIAAEYTTPVWLIYRRLKAAYHVVHNISPADTYNTHFIFLFGSFILLYVLSVTGLVISITFILSASQEVIYYSTEIKACMWKW